MKLRNVTLFFVCIIGIVNGYAQLSHHEENTLFNQADELLLSGEYEQAARNYKILQISFPEKEIYSYRLGVCHIETSGFEKQGLDELLKIKNHSEFEDYEYYMGEAYYLNFNFKEALRHYDAFHKEIDRDVEDIETYKSLENLLALKMAYCMNAMRVFDDTSNTVKKVNIGLPINTLGNEYVPCITPDESMMVFTYRGEKSMGGKLNPHLKKDEKHGKYHEDIYVSYRKDDKSWGEPIFIESINTIGNDAALGLSHNGESMIIFRSSFNNPGDLYISNHVDSTWTTPEKIKGDVNSKAWEGSASLTTNEKMMFFSSEREGGFGGKDIYSAELLDDGSWGKVKNLGPEVNTSHDEDSPYIHPDGITLYYSSNGIYSIGGYDVLVSKKDSLNEWQHPNNAGYPFNTLKDDRDYVLTADAKTAYFAHASGHGHNDFDIFTIPAEKLGETPILAIITGSVFVDDIFQTVDVFVHDLETGHLEGRSSTNTPKHRFKMLLQPEKSYVMTVVQADKELHRDTLDMHELKEFMRMKHDFNIYSDDFNDEKLQMEFDIEGHYDSTKFNVDHLTMNEDSTVAVGYTHFINGEDTLDFKELHDLVHQNKQEFYEENKHLAEADNVVLNADGTLHKKHSMTPELTKHETIFRVQVGAYRKPKNFKWAGQKAYGDVKEETYDDGITRFTIGGTHHLKESKALRLKVIDYGIKDAFIIVFHDGVRMSLEEYFKVRRAERAASQK